MKPTLEILLQPDGKITIDALGFRGPDCEQATQFLETALGLTREKRRKPEYHQSRRGQNQQRLGA